MQIYAVTIRWPAATPQALAAAVRSAAAAFPRLDERTLMHAEHREHGVCVAAISHGPHVAAPRSYRAHDAGATVLFDGLPADRHARFAAHDAATLLRRWHELADCLEGVFSTVRIDHRSGHVECLLDALGMAQVYVVARPRGWALSNSVEVLRLLAGADRPDPLGLSSLLTLGWPAGDRTLLSGIGILPGGHVHRFGERWQPRALLTPATVVPGGMPAPRPVGELAAAMTRTMRAAADGIGPLRCGLTAGRDSRVVLALALAARLPVELFTSGHADDLDVRAAREIAGLLGLAHETIAPELPADAADWARQTARFVAQTDGLASLWDVADWSEHQRPVERLGLKLWGPGGEIGRAGNVGIGIPFMANTPGLRRSWGAQRWVLEHKAHGFGGLVTAAAMDETLRYLRRYLAERRAEGWRPREVLESYYAFERVKHWAAAGVRRASDGTDVFAPFVSRDYISYCYSLTPGRRYMEAAHRGLLSALSAQLRDLPFEHPWKPQRPRAAAAHVALETARWARGRIARRHAAPPARRPFPHSWLEAGLPLQRELSLSFGDSPLWDYVDRRRWESLITASADDRAPHAEGAVRVLTALWYFHARHEADVTPQST